MKTTTSPASYNNPFSQGSIWRKWDLHFHTPSSYDYQDKSITNQTLINTLLKNDISAVAITDHHTINIERYNELYLLGQQKDIFVLPGIELVTDKGGQDSIHIIGVFPPEGIGSNWDKIKGTLNLTQGDISKKGAQSIYVNLEKACDLIHKLGGLVSIHAGKKTNSIENITNALSYKMALKIDILEHIDIFEVGRIDDIKNYKENVYPNIPKNPPMILCSDNHNANSYYPKAALWIKADPTFSGLKQIIFEPESGARTFVGEEPEIIAKVKNNKTKYIRSLSINQHSGYKESTRGIWFKDVNIDLNKGLIAIIGNKGDGKSAIADILGLLSDSKNSLYFSFLNRDKFIKGGLAANFVAKLTWEDKNSVLRILNHTIDSSSVEKCKYLPQQYFEKLCNEIDKSNSFQEELEHVVFNHLKEEDRLGCTSFKKLIEKKSGIIKSSVSRLIDNLIKINVEIVDLEKKRNPKYINEVKNKIEQKVSEISALTKPTEVANPQDDESLAKKHEETINKITSISRTIELLERAITRTKNKIIDLNKTIEQLNSVKAIILQKEEEFNVFKETWKSTLLMTNIDIDEIFIFQTNHKPIDNKLIELQNRLTKLRPFLFTQQEMNKLQPKQSSLLIKLDEKKKEKTAFQDGLDEPAKLYQKYLETYRQWERDKVNLEGSKSQPETLLYLKEEIRFVENDLATEINNKRKNREEILLQIFRKKKEIIDIYNLIKASVDQIISENASLLLEYSIGVKAGFGLDPSFYSLFFRFINQNVKGTFRGIAEGEMKLKDLFNGKNLNSEKDIVSILSTIIKYFEEDQREEAASETEHQKLRYIDNQIAELESFYSFLFGLDYLNENYQLQLDKKDLNELSPGEKGALLLTFYLMLDKDTIPLIIDQPEDNLDNQSVVKILVPFIKKAKSNRQVIMVTHNPNLAVVADAEQIIYVNINKENQRNEFSFKSGSIENPEINQCIIDVLEGTWPAFDNRRIKYILSKQTIPVS